MWEHLNVEIRHFVRRKTFPGWKIMPRQIGEHELVYIMHGKGEIIIQGNRFLVSPGDLICFRPGVEHSLHADREPCMEFYGVHFDTPEELDGLPLPDVYHVQGRRLEPLFRSLEEAWRQKSTMSRWRQNLLTEQIVCEAMEDFQSQYQPYHSVRIRRVLEQIHADPLRQIILEDLLNISGLRKTAFLQAFREVTGTTPVQYVQMLRLELSCELLSQTELSVAQVAEKSGFSDPFYFSRVFRKHFGLSPSRWRSSRE